MESLFARYKITGTFTSFLLISPLVLPVVNSITGHFYVSPLTVRAATGTSKLLPASKFITTIQTTIRIDD